VIFGTKRVSRNSGITNFETHFSTKSQIGSKNFLKSTFLGIFLFLKVQIQLSIRPSITDGVHRNENLVEIIPVFSTFSNFFKKKKKKIIKAILCNFSMRLLKYF
jgi:hypothetical protein